MNVIMFPFDRVKKGAIVAIYGAGEISDSFLSQLSAVHYCQVYWLVDRKFDSKELQGDLVCLPPSLMDWQLPDQIVIASQAFKNEINKYLLEQGVPASKLIMIGNEQEIDVLDLIQSRLSATPSGYDWGAYYKSAELATLAQFNKFIKPVIEQWDKELDYSNVLDFACGEGRIAELMLERCQHLQLIDASTKAVDFCRERFAKYPHVQVQCNAAGVLPQADGSLSLVYSWDAMVHFSYKSLDFYLCEFSRVLQSNGHVFIHHSNLATLSDQMRVLDLWSLNIGGRSNISKDDISFIAKHHGFEVIGQTVINWGVENMDCISVLRKL
ncbi:ubiquinone/menaquinone biosynthesis C-methylase UbiE [Aeromonas hydrophila]|uniref:class I SAM-dependent methyltransferase n=1 Tax=Aeromonas hydrophila TaxID=644 RepID=UPI002169D7D7|nr:class I SAM-dependent methyltransferase [Aeromonas hydrophila]MCS3769177.1 ubiquinone/menaquinone biosynthesis C-methylase UbiE [Aeromonas hydrophila]MCS3793417.1 ubiquinone/menaquinone biosynthesis C-methylase UbiE [Aeromonas hydrophila]